MELHARSRAPDCSLTETSLDFKSKLAVAVCGGIMPQVGRVGKQILLEDGEAAYRFATPVQVIDRL